MSSAADTPTGSGRPPSAGEVIRDRLFRWFTRAVALLVFLLLLGLFAQIGNAARPAITADGWKFVSTDKWDGKENFGVRPQIWGTLVSSVLGVSLATVFGLAIAIFLTQGFLPVTLNNILGTAIELLAAIPSVVYGLWGLFVVIPLLQPIADWLFINASGIPFFSTLPMGPGMLPASLVLAIMILPTIAAVSRSALLSVDRRVREGALALGATRWEAIRKVIVPAAFGGITGSVVLGFGRALGETMALAMLVGNSANISWSLFSPADTLAAMLANRFPEAGPNDMTRLMYAALVLLTLTMIVNAAGAVILRRAGVRK
jgi:phosphate transport system permease protein